MDSNKRRFLGATIPWALMAPYAMLADRATAQNQSDPARIPGMPPPPGPPEPPEWRTPVNAPKPEERRVPRQNQKRIHDDVEKLCTLADELKKQVEETDSGSVLSVSVVNLSKEVEKLAKEVKNLAEG